MKLRPLIVGYVLSGVLVLSGCALWDRVTMPTTPMPHPVEYVCASATAALETVNRFFDKLAPGTIAAVAQAKAITDPVCTQEEVPTLSDAAMNALRGALTQLTNASIEASR